ncbi:hypothetical protein D3C87_1172450 [compost metagenome]
MGRQQHHRERDNQVPQRPRGQPATLHPRRAPQYGTDDRHLQRKQACDQHYHLRLKHLPSRSPRHRQVLRTAPGNHLLFAACDGRPVLFPQVPGALGSRWRKGTGGAWLRHCRAARVARGGWRTIVVIIGTGSGWEQHPGDMRRSDLCGVRIMSAPGTKSSPKRPAEAGCWAQRRLRHVLAPEMIIARRD